MRHPLISLWRHGRQVHFLAQDAAAESWPPSGCVWRPFTPGADALNYLRFWQGDAAAQADLRHLLRITGGSAPPVGVPARRDDRLLASLAARLTDGTLRVAEADWAGTQRIALGQLCLPPAGADSPLDGLPTLGDLPAVAELPPLLPALEQVQIEGAEVMPEVLQSLEQIDASLGSLESLTTSLGPLPDRVPEVPQAMAQAGAALRRELDAL